MRAAISVQALRFSIDQVIEDQFLLVSAKLKRANQAVLEARREPIEAERQDLERRLKEINDPKKRQEIEKEIADIFNYLIKLVDVLDIDLEKAALNKIKENAEKYPINHSKGKSVKYTDFNED